MATIMAHAMTSKKNTHVPQFKFKIRTLGWRVAINQDLHLLSSWKSVRMIHFMRRTLKLSETPHKMFLWRGRSMCIVLWGVGRSSRQQLLKLMGEKKLVFIDFCTVMIQSSVLLELLSWFQLGFPEFFVLKLSPPSPATAVAASIFVRVCSRRPCAVIHAEEVFWNGKEPEMTLDSGLSTFCITLKVNVEDCSSNIYGLNIFGVMDLKVHLWINSFGLQTLELDDTFNVLLSVEVLLD